MWWHGKTFNRWAKIEQTVQSENATDRLQLYEEKGEAQLLDATWEMKLTLNA
jgi:hypothetical protein